MNDSTNLPVSPAPNRYGPVTAGEMLERTAALLRENFKLFFGITALSTAVEIFIVWILGVAISPVIAFARMRLAHFTIVLIPALLVGAAIVLAIVVITFGALFIAAGARMARVSITIGGSFSAAEKFWRLVGIAVLICLRAIGYAILFCLVVGIPAFALIVFAGASSFLRHSAGHLSVAAAAVAILVALVCIALGVLFYFWLYARYALAIPVALAENLSVTESIHRSIQLSKGSRGRLYALFAAVLCIYFGFILITIPLELIAFHGMVLHPAAPTGGFIAFRILLDIFGIILGLVITATNGVGITVCYYDLRVRKEGFGLPQTPPATAPSSPSWPPASDFPAEDFPMA